MIILTGSNLGERQRELNEKVKEAAAENVKFDEIKNTDEESDVDKFFKIDLASRYRRMDYIVEVLKSGDSLFISRALKCTWIYDDIHSKIISPDNLHNNVIPFMSSKMKKKLLSAISANVKDETRAADFYKYCMDNKLKTIALKFLNFTDDTFKLEVLKDKAISNHLVLDSDNEYPKNFVKLSFTVADAYVQVFNRNNRMSVFRGLSYLYTVSEDKYLDMLEKHVEGSPYNSTYLGLRISKSIMKQHKVRVLKNPLLYVRILSKSVVKKYITVEDAKIFAAAVLPDSTEIFWNQNYCTKYKFLLDKITVGKFQFVKQIFTDKYPEQHLETTTNFYQKELYKLMTAEEQEIWALKQMASEKEILGIGKDYLWYKFVSFDKAFEEIRKLVLITTDNMKRADMMLVLVDSAKNQRDIVKLLTHFYERHVNELKCIKENFLDRIFHNFNVFEFNEDFWAVLHRMFNSLGVYNLYDFNSKTEYRLLALVYLIINQKDLHEAIINQMHDQMQFYTLRIYTDKLTKEQKEMVFEYLFKSYMDEIRKMEDVPYEDEVKYRLRKYIHFTLDLLDQYGKTKEDCPELVIKFMNLDSEEFECHRLFRDSSKREITPVDLLRDLKKDAKLLVAHLPLIEINIENSYMYKITTVLRKLKTYFSKDIAKDYLEFFETLYAKEHLWHKVAQAAAHGIFQLGNEKSKLDFMDMYAPIEYTIDHGEIHENLLRIQQAICAHVCYSRPPVPLKAVLAYVKGDYVQYCLPMFHYYLANLPLPLCMEFVEAILDTPVSIQKHGIRLAFECFNAESLNTLVLRAWKNTKNVSLRMIIYKAVVNKICEDKNVQDLLFDTLKKITLTLQPEDDEEIFRLFISPKLPNHLMNECIEMAWKVVSQFPPKPVNLTRMRNVILFMCSKIDTIRQEFVHGFIEQFVATTFIQEEEYDIKLSSEAAALIDAKWKLSATFIINMEAQDDLDKKIKLTKLILKKCLKDTGSIKRKRALLKNCFNFINELEKISYSQDKQHYTNVNKIMHLVLETLDEAIAIEETYMVVWDIQLGIVVRKVLADNKVEYTEREVVDKQIIKEIANLFANELGVLLKEVVDKELFFASFSSDIQNKIISKTQTLKSLIIPRTKFADMMTNVCLGLMSFEVSQIYILVLNLLPASCRYEYKEEFKAVIIKANTMDNKEIRCNLFRKLADPEYDGEFMTLK